MKGIGGGIITRKLLLAVLLISSLSLTGIASASAADVGTVQNQVNNTSIVQEKNITQIKNPDSISRSATTQNSSEKTNNPNSASFNGSLETNHTEDSAIIQSTVNTPKSNNPTNTSLINQKTINSSSTSNNNQNNEASAGETKAVSTQAVSGTVSVSQVLSAAKDVATYMDKTGVIPTSIGVGSHTVNPSQFLILEANAIIQTYYKTNTLINLTGPKGESSPIQQVSSGTILENDYVNMASRVWFYMLQNNQVPNCVDTPLGKLDPGRLLFSQARILAFSKDNSYLPSYVTIRNPIGPIIRYSIPSDLQIYLQSSANCQVTNAQIQALAKQLSGGSNGLAAATAIYNWVRDNLGYSFYYNTKYGAVGALNARTGNCVDTAHLLIALERAAGIPAKYEHVYAQFSSGNWYGHVVAQVYVNGVWYIADATSSYNTFGVVNNWNRATATLYGYYASLPF
jgi:hypothetical protein